MDKDTEKENPVKTKERQNIDVTAEAVIARKQRFLRLLSESQNLAKAYIGAGYHAKTLRIAHDNACRLLSQMRKKASQEEILNDVGLNPTYVASKIKSLVDNKNPAMSAKGLNLVTRCMGWQQPNINIGVGMQIVITDQSAIDGQGKAVDVTSYSVTPATREKAEQIKE